MAKNLTFDKTYNIKSEDLRSDIDKPTLEIMKAIKKVFDPNGVLNSGKCLFRKIKFLL
jgi:FAD/FMN-containing dehydrogenase